jgi:O-antigen/teichoic acid export membrane protein
VGSSFADPSLLYAGVYRASLGVSGLLTVLVVMAKLTPDEQGYFYTLNSLGSMAMFVELGLLSLIIIFAGHEWSLLSLDSRGHPVGSSKALSRLTSLGHFGAKWFATGSALLVVIMVLVGRLLLRSHQVYRVVWQAPFYLLCIANGLTAFVAFPQALLEGCHQVREVYLCRLQSMAAGNLALWVGILCGLGLWSLSLGAFLNCVWTIGFLLLFFAPMLSTLCSQPQGEAISWRRELMPLQWRVAVGYLCSYILYYAFTPLLFYYRGPVEAGQMAVTWAGIEIISTVAGTPNAIRIPAFNALVAVADRQSLNRLSWQTALLAVALNVLGATSFMLLLIAATNRGYAFSERLLPLWPTAILFIGSLVKQVGTCMTNYVRAHKVEPFIPVSVASTLTFLAGALPLTTRFGTTGLALAFTVAQSVVGFPLIIRIFLAYYRVGSAEPSLKAN